jgi:alanine racemase
MNSMYTVNSNVGSTAGVTVNLSRVRANALAIRKKTGVDVIAVVKADAYGLGAVAVADTIKDVVSGFYVFSAREAIDCRLSEITGKSTLAAVPDPQLSPQALREHKIRQSVWSSEMAKHYAPCDPVLSVDTGMQRFAAAAKDVRKMLDEFEFSEAFTHGVRPEHASELQRIIRESTSRTIRLHAAASSLLNTPTAHLNATRPGLALYDSAVTVQLPLVEARSSRGLVGYTRFEASHHGVILAGYSNGLAPGPCVVNGRPQRIVEVGMQSSYVTLDAADRAGEMVTLLGGNVSLNEIAGAWGVTPQQVLVRLTKLGDRKYIVEQA